MNRLLTLAIGLLAISIVGCGPTPTGEVNESLPLHPGCWDLSMDIGEKSIPVRLEIDDTLAFTFVNAGEHIPLPSIILRNDSLFFEMPHFESAFSAHIINDREFKGLWHNLSKDDYTIPFTATYRSDIASHTHELEGEDDKYAVTFSPGTEDEYPAVGVFRQKDSLITGTFLTETGDYRYLEGTKIDNHLRLSCFDGSHLFLFEGDQTNDSIINGVFHSGYHWSEPWVAVKDPEAQLAHPDSLTYLLPGYDYIEFTVLNKSGDSVFFDQNTLLDKVTIVQIFGSWCPNCYDENLFFKSLFDKYADQGLEILPVAFEAHEDHALNVAAVERQFQSMEIPYTPYFGGIRSKKETSKMFSMLNDIISYPTSIFIDKEGKVRKIHTGFYGPGTGRYYDEYVASTTEFVEALLAE